jgi:hypothetical protein
MFQHWFLSNDPSFCFRSGVTLVQRINLFMKRLMNIQLPYRQMTGTGFHCPNSMVGDFEECPCKLFGEVLMYHHFLPLLFIIDSK